MLKHFDHVTIAVTDVPAAVRFFGLLGFELDKDVVISGPVMDLHFNRPVVKPAADVARLDRIGFNHICFAVEDIDAVIAKVTAAGVRLRNEMMIFHERKLVSLEGPEGIIV